MLKHPIFNESSNNASLIPLLQFQCVRWRKRRWAPPNKSKEFYVREPTPIDPEEWADLKKRYDLYRTEMRAIRKYFKTELKASTAQASSVSAFEDQENEWREGILQNESWNAHTGQIREARVSGEETSEEEKRLELLIRREEKAQAQQAAAARHVQQEVENSAHFIQMSSLEMEIEKALNQRFNYNFCIDLDGNRYVEQPDGTTSKETSCDLKQIHSIEEAKTEEQATSSVDKDM